jgi:glycosyltransferase involved in cell wall biosynthesis
MEAMALGLPVVSTNVGGIPYILEQGKTGLMVNDNDSESMVQAIIELYKQPFLASSISECARIYVEQFDWKLIKERWVKILIG